MNLSRYIVVAIGNFSKWSEAQQLKNKTIVSVARFLYNEVICCRGYLKIQISDQGCEFVNMLNNELFRIFETEQRVISEYYLQANNILLCLVGR